MPFLELLPDYFSKGFLSLINLTLLPPKKILKLCVWPPGHNAALKDLGSSDPVAFGGHNCYFPGGDFVWSSVPTLLRVFMEVLLGGLSLVGLCEWSRLLETSFVKSVHASWALLVSAHVCSPGVGFVCGYLHDLRGTLVAAFLLDISPFCYLILSWDLHSSFTPTASVDVTPSVVPCRTQI